MNSALRFTSLLVIILLPTVSVAQTAPGASVAPGAPVAPCAPTAPAAPVAPGFPDWKECIETPDETGTPDWSESFDDPKTVNDLPSPYPEDSPADEAPVHSDPTPKIEIIEIQAPRNPAPSAPNK